MKTTIKEYIGIATLSIASAVLHVGPVVGIMMVAIGDEMTRALGAAVILFLSVGLGYIHGLNRTYLK